MSGVISNCVTAVRMQQILTRLDMHMMVLKCRNG